MTDDQEHAQSGALPPAEPESLLNEFWPALVAVVDDCARAGDFDCRFGFQISCGNNGGCDPEALSRAVQQRVEGLAWPVADPSALRPRQILDLVEFFHECVAFPVWDICSFCEQSHVIAGDSAIAREKYADVINTLFRRFNQPFTLQEGKVSDASMVAPSIAAGATRVSLALDEADALARSHRAARGVEPVYDALHGYMRAACQAVDEVTGPDATVGMAALFTHLHAHHPALRSVGARQSDVDDVLRALCDALDALHPVRRTDTAAGTADLLGEAEALLAINAARALFVYLDTMLQIPTSDAATSGSLQE